jgi:UDP-N-acetyl-D-glucosamine/UDP-N-acetyl-D-galactosamine dehydrogenase
MTSAGLEKIAVIGLGYVGLPVAVAFAKAFSGVVGFDISKNRVEALHSGVDATGEIASEDLKASTLKVSDEVQDLKDTTFFVVTVPTPIDSHRRPDLSPLESACKLIGPHLSAGAIVVFESTVYPGVTEDFCGPLLEKYSGLKRGRDFKLGYSPERINPGDKEHRLQSITKIVSAEDPATLERVASAYGAIIDVALYRAQSIRVAEAAKVLENTQRDLNIALMNELSLMMDLMNIRTKDVLDAAATKWNFIRFNPGLVGGHCIGVDPYYLTSAAEQLGYHPQVILAGRRINDEMGRVVARKAVKLLIEAGVAVKGARVGILGLTFKENVPDLRNSKVPDIVGELKEFGISCLIHDPIAEAASARREYGLEMSSLKKFEKLDALILAVNHRAYLKPDLRLAGMVKEGGVLIDVKSALDPKTIPKSLLYWSL